MNAKKTMVEVDGASIPIFSLTELKAGERTDALHECMKTKGFFYITDYGISEEDHALPAAAAMEFFEQATAEEKARVITEQKVLRRGFSPLGSESTAKVTNSGTFSDYVMKYSMGASNNIFPNKSFETSFTKYYETITKVSREITEHILRAMSSSSSVPEKLDSLYRFLYYPNLPPERASENEKLRMAAHYDVSIITLIHQTACETGFVSLQYEVNGRFVDVPSIPGTMVVQNGAILTLLTDGAVKVPRHRVVAPPLSLISGSSRTSSVFFMRPGFDFDVDLRLLRACGFDVLAVQGDRTTLGEWLGVNHIQHQTVAQDNKK